MLTPIELVAKSPRHVAVSNLHACWRVYAASVGMLQPVVWVDRKAESRAGFDAMLWHESLHAAEFHALLGGVLLALGLVGVSVAITLQLWLSAVLCPLASLAFYAFWRREQEVRADAMALYASGIGGLSPEHPHATSEYHRRARAMAGLAEFRAFLWLHPHPCEVAGLSRLQRVWEAWKYGASRDAREARAARRCRRLGWQVPFAAARG